VIRCWADLHSDPDPNLGIYSSTISNIENSAALLLFSRCQHYIADDFSDEPDFSNV